MTLISVVTLLALTGCGPFKRESVPVNRPFVNKLNVETGHVDTQFDTHTISSNVYDPVQVLTMDGKPVNLNAKKVPLLFEAYWCPHCQRTLVSLNQNESKLKRLPVLISTGFAPGTSLKTAVTITRQEESAFHLHNFQVFYLLSVHEVAKDVPAYPTMVFPYEGKVELLSGEHTLSVWQKALGAANHQ